MASLSHGKNGRVIRVLHVEDDAATLEVSKEILMMNGNFEVDHASSVNEAFKKLDAQPYDVVVSDYEMPQKDGLEFLRELREQKNQVPFVLFTGKGREEVAINALNLGADAYINKQGNPETVYGELSHAIVKTVEKKTAEEALRKNEEQMKAIILNAPIGIAWSDANSVFLSANESFCRTLGYSEEELRKLTFKDITHPEEISGSVSKMQELIAGKIQFFSQEKRYIKKDKTVINGKVTVSAIRDKEGKPTLFVAELEDITERKKAEKELQLSEQRYHELADFLPEIIFEIDEEGKLVFANAEAYEITGYSREDFARGFTVLNIIAPEEKKRASKNISKVLSGIKKKPSQYTFVRKNGTRFPAIISSAPIVKDGRVTGARGLVVDITERKRAEEEIAASEAKYRALVENADDAILLSDLRGKAIYRNPAYFKQLGFKEGESDAFAKLHPDDLSAVKKKMNELFKTGFSTFEYRVKHHNGSWISRVVRSTLIYNRRKEPYAVLSIIRDITEQKVVEQKLKENHERIEMMNEKLRVVGSLTRHDVRNKLSAIAGYAYILRKKCADKPDIVEKLSGIEKAVNESAKIFDFAKLYEEIGSQEREYVSVEKALTEAASLFSGFIPKIVNKCRGLTVLADSFLSQLFYNFIDNTQKHGQKATKIEVYFREEEKCLKLIYQDDGVGISADNKAKLFNKGFSTGGSTGFGLFLIRRMLDFYEWNVTEEGKPKNGAKFVITIPKTSKDGQRNYIIKKDLSLTFVNEQMCESSYLTLHHHKS